MKQLPRPAMWFASIDYLRVTVPGKRMADFERALISGMERIGAEGVDGATNFERWAWMGYTGFRMDSMAFGYREDAGYIYQASGVQAQSLYNLCLEYNGVPRIDVQVTCWYENYCEWVAEEVAARSYAVSHGARGNPWRVRHVKGFGAGDTAYLGSRGKETRYVRVYDKYKERKDDPDYLNAWRWEVEFTDGYAREVYGRLLDSGASPWECAGVVYSVLRERGVILQGLDRSTVHEVPKVKRPESDINRTLLWLQMQVAPSLDKLQARGVSYERIIEHLFNGKRIEENNGHAS